MKKLVAAAALAALAVPAIAPAQDLEAAIEIDSRIKHQHVTGFGGFSPSPTWSYWLGNAEMDKLFGKGDNQLGLNILRLYMANSCGAWSGGVSNAKRAKRYGAFIFASPWSPPASWKDNGSADNGGALLPSHYADWATFLNDYYLYMGQQGVEVDAVSVQNEPDWKASYQSCIWTGAQMADFLKNHGHLIQCKVIAPEGIHFTRTMHEPILNDPEACERLDILGGHFYGWDGSSYPLAARKGKEVWMTEYLINERQQNDGLAINWKDDGFLFARSINDAMLADMSAWVHYSLKRYYGCLGDGTYGTVDNQITKRGYILSHYAKYVSGTTRVHHGLRDESGKLTASAYLTASGDSVVAMVINPGEFSYELEVTLPFTIIEGTGIVTTENYDMDKTEMEFDETWQPLVDLPPYSVNTFVFKRYGQRPGYSENIDEGEVVYTDGFAEYGASCIPPGWRSKAEDGIRYAGSYSMGPRLMSFSPEGMMSTAFYFRAGTDGAGYLSYGEEADYPLTLAPGNYTLTFSLEGWKSTPTIKASVRNSGGRTITSLDCRPEGYVSSNGSAVNITDATDFTLTFSITEQTNARLRWIIPAASAGYRECLLGNIRLVRNEDSGITSVTADPAVGDGILYDMCGRPVGDNPAPGLYIRDGRKVLVR